MEENLEYFRELIPDAPAWVHNQLAHERADLEAAIKKAKDEANTWANKWADDRNELTEYKQLAESQRELFKKMEAELDAKDALIRELRDVYYADISPVVLSEFGSDPLTRFEVLITSTRSRDVKELGYTNPSKTSYHGSTVFNRIQQQTKIVQDSFQESQRLRCVSDV